MFLGFMLLVAIVCGGAWVVGEQLAREALHTGRTESTGPARLVEIENLGDHYRLTFTGGFIDGPLYSHDLSCWHKIEENWETAELVIDEYYHYVAWWPDNRFVRIIIRYVWDFTPVVPPPPTG